MRITCCGGVGEEGRSCLWFMPSTGEGLMVDCGVQREFSPGQPGRYPLFPADLPPTFPVLVTHAHEDHAAALPLLIAKGYTPRVYATEKTIALAPGYCQSWLKAVGKAIAKDGGELPYGEEHIKAIDWRPFTDEECEIDSWLVRRGRAAHLPGSSWFLLVRGERLICVSGDWNPASVTFLPPEFPPCDLFITDAVGKPDDARGFDELRRLAESSAEKPVFLPLPRFGRSQEMLAFLAALPELAERRGAVAMDAAIVEGFDAWQGDADMSPAGAAAVARARGLFASGAWLAFTKPEEIPDGPRLIGAVDAMLSAGHSQAIATRVLAAGGLVAFSGHAAAGTAGRTLLDSGNPAVSRMPWKIHPNAVDVSAALSTTGAKTAVLVHTPRDRAIALAEKLRARHAGVTIQTPGPGDTIVA